MIDYHRIEPFTGRGDMKGWKRDIERLELRIVALEKEVKKCRAEVRKREKEEKA